MRRSLPVLLLILLAALSACAPRKAEPLRRAERLLPEQPDSALTVLEAFDPAGLSEHGQAEYAYLDALSFYTAYFFLDTPREAALSDACLYFEQNGTTAERMRAWELFSTVLSASGRHSAGLAALRRAEAAARKAEAARMRTGFLLLLLVAILATLILYSWARRSQIARQLSEEKAENDRLMAVAEDLQARLSRKSGASAAGRDALDRLCEQYYVYEGTDNLQPKILKEVKGIVEGLRSDPKVQKELERALDESCDGVMTRLRTAFPKWKEEDFLLYCFTASGFSSTTIAALLEKDKPYVYNRLYRLKSRIAQTGGADADFFLGALEK